MRTVDAGVIHAAVRDGRAELIGRVIGDPAYFAGAIWQVTTRRDAYELVVDPRQIAVCANALRRLRATRAAHRRRDR